MRVASVHPVAAIVMLGLLATCRTPSIAADATAQPAASPSPVVDPVFLLIHDDLVRQTLSLSATQRASIDRILLENNLLLLAIRDIGPQSAPESVAPKIKEAKAKLLAQLDAKQTARLGQLVLQAQGYDALFDPKFQAAIELTDEQITQLRQIGDDFRQTVQSAKGPASAEELNTAKKTRHERILTALTPQQQQKWAERLGPLIDFSKVRSAPAWAPEFGEVEVWLNSPPLTIEALRGRVVVIHFFAFGCSNCIQNYPWYRAWQTDFPNEKVTMIGIHTPETKAENDVQLLEAKLRENELQFPVAVDNKKRNWQNWSNSMWPSVYLVDKQGRVRYWWYGELNWQGAGGQQIMKQRIQQLMAEE